VRFSLLETKGLDELLQEERDAVIDRKGKLGGREPFPHLIPATPDQLESIRSHELVEHRTTMHDPFLGVWSKLLTIGISANYSPMGLQAPDSFNCSYACLLSMGRKSLGIKILFPRVIATQRYLCVYAICDGRLKTN